MCGIFGIINGAKNRTPSRDICNLIEQAFTVNSLRGSDATGLFQVDKGKVFAHKKAVHGAVFAGLDETTPYIADADTCNVMVAHNRAATVGASTNKNAHPFTFHTEDNKLVSGVHNGTLHNWGGAHKDKYGVDSEWAIAHITKNKLDAFKDIQGAYCFVWYDQSEPGVLSILRNYERPMYAVYVKDQNRMLFASEFMMLAWLAHRNDIKIETDIIELSPSKCYKFSLENPREFTTVDVPNVTRSYTSGTYEDRQITVIKGFIKCLTDAAPATTGKGKKDKPRYRLGAEYVSAEEIRTAKVTDDLNTSVLFSPEHLDPTSKECWGTVHYPDGDSVAGIIRRVPQVIYEGWLRTEGLRCKVVGAKPGKPDKTGVSDLVLILSRDVKEVSTEELSSLESAISAEVAKFQNRVTH